MNSGLLILLISPQHLKNYELQQFRLCVDGIWESIVIDDFFPCHKRTKSMVFAIGRKNQVGDVCFLVIPSCLFFIALGFFDRKRTCKNLRQLCTTSSRTNCRGSFNSILSISENLLNNNFQVYRL